MRKLSTGVLVCMAALLAVAALTPSAAAQCSAQSSWFSSPSLPSDVSTPVTDCAFQQFSWQSFIALAQSNMFMGYMPSQGVFVASGSQPLKWGQQPAIPAGCGSGATMLLDQIDKTDPDSAILEAQDVQPLVDQNGNWVHYGIQMNQTAYNYLVNCSLWQGGCFNYAGTNSTISFPWSSSNTQGNSVVIKTAWKVLAGSDNPANYITAKAAISPAGPTNSGCTTVTVGLVGMHITQKTPTQPEWVWSTFEHVNNDPPCSALTTPPPLGGTWSFYKTGCSGNYCTANTYFNPCSGDSSTCGADDGPNDFCAKCTKPGIPTQVCLVNPTGGDTSGTIPALNTSVWGLAPAGSIMKNYKLIGTEWTVGGTVGGTIAGSVSLENSVAETYVQSLDSCFSCHKTTFHSYPPSSAYATSQADFSHLFDAIDPSTTSSCNPITPPSGYTCPAVTGTASTTGTAGARPAPMASHKK